MTEDEALSKWCPFARIDGSRNRDYNKHPVHTLGVKCIASSCMAWRTSNTEEHRVQKSAPEGEGWVLVSTVPSRTWSRIITAGGRCGLAGG